MQDNGSQRRIYASTDSFAEEKRLALWRETSGGGIANVEITPVSDVPFHADVTFHLLPNVSIAYGPRSSAHYRLTPELLKQGRDIVVVSILRSGGASAARFEEELIDGVGSVGVAGTDPSASTLHTEGSFITLALSRPALAELAPNFAAVFGRPIPADDPALGLLIKYLDTVLATDELGNADVARSVSAHILDLVSLALGACSDQAGMARMGAKAARLRALKSDIAAMLGRNDLSSEIIAGRHGISARYVRKLFEQEGNSFTRFLLTKRLTRVGRLLRDPRHGQLTIAQVAHNCGFNDISYFSRAFRRRFGATPTEFREGGKGS
jgi:AraC-like DNA-binding protein